MVGDLIKELSTYVTLPALILYGLITGCILLRGIKIKEEMGLTRFNRQG